MKYVELLIPAMSEDSKGYLEHISRLNGIFQDRNTVRKSLDQTRLIGKAFDHMLVVIPDSILLHVFTQDEVIAYVNNPINGYITQEDLEGGENG